MLRQDHGAEQVKRDRSRTKGKTLKCTVNFGGRGGGVRRSPGLGKQGKSECQSPSQVGGFKGVGDGESLQSRTCAELG